MLWEHAALRLTQPWSLFCTEFGTETCSLRTPLKMVAIAKSGAMVIITHAITAPRICCMHAALRIGACNSLIEGSVKWVVILEARADAGPFKFWAVGQPSRGGSSPALRAHLLHNSQFSPHAPYSSLQHSTLQSHIPTLPFLISFPPLLLLSSPSNSRPLLPPRRDGSFTTTPSKSNLPTTIGHLFPHASTLQSTF